MKKKETIESRAVKIAAQKMAENGLCRYNSVSECSKIFTCEKFCRDCIERWLISKARKELKREGKLE